MLASIHVADLGPRRTLPLIAKGPSGITAPGLRNANLALAARLGGPLPTKTDIGRIALLAMWDDDDALDRFLEDAPIAQTFAGGWHVRLAPLRAHGSWPGLADDLSKSRRVEGEGAVGVFTMGRVKIPRLPAFLKYSTRAEARVVGAPGLVWATALVRPPFVATCSLWESADASTAYAYTQGDAHNDAIAAGRAKPFHHQEAFVRFRPYASVGYLDGKNPLPDNWLARV